MREFNLNEVNAGDELPCRDGKHTGKILCFNKGQMIVLVSGPEVNDVLKYDLNGKNEWADREDFGHDLMLPDPEPAHFIAIFKHKISNNLYADYTLHKSFNDAYEMQNMPIYKDFWDLVKIVPVLGVMT